MSFDWNQRYQNGFGGLQSQRNTESFSGSHSVLRYEDIRFKAALGPKEVELLSGIPQESLDENPSIVRVELAPLCYDTRVFDEEEEEGPRGQGNGGNKEEEARKKNQEIVGTEGKQDGGRVSVDGDTMAIKEDKKRENVIEDLTAVDEGPPAPVPADEKIPKDEAKEGRKRKSETPSLPVKEQVPEKKRAKSRKPPSDEKQKAQLSAKKSPETAALKIANKKKFTHEELQLPSPEWKAYIVSVGTTEKNMVYHSPEGIVCHSLEMVKGVEARRKDTLKLKGALHGLMRRVEKLKRKPKEIDNLDARHASKDAVLLYRISRARSFADEN